VRGLARGADRKADQTPRAMARRGHSADPSRRPLVGLDNLVKMGKGEHARVHPIRWEGVTGGTGVIMLRIRAVLMTPTQCSTLAYLTLRRG
jgi:hypothetical protein